MPPPASAPCVPMKLNILAKLFLALFFSLLVLSGAMMASVQWSVRTGFAEYLHKVEAQRLATLAGKLAEAYGENGASWNFLRGNREYWFEFLHDQFAQEDAPETPGLPVESARAPSPEELPPEDLFGPADFPSPFGPPPGAPPPHGPHHGPPPEGPHFAGRLRLLDAERLPVAGPPHAIHRDEKETLHAVIWNGNTVGWLAFASPTAITDRLQLAFLQQQAQVAIAILALALAVSVLVSWLLARQFLLPVRRIAAGAQALAAGRFDTQIHVSSRDELGRLAHDFNLLARTLQRNEQDRRRWVADISHELRTPLAILRGEIEALQDGIREFSPERLRSLHAEVLGLSKLVDDLYELSLYDLGALQYRMETVDLGDLLEETAAGFRARFADRGIRLDGPQPACLMISGDSRRLRQLFSNLLENSCRYTDPGGVCEIRLGQEDGRAVAEFRDSAPGVPEEALARLFERLYRVDKSRSRELGGAGLGLAICRNIVEAHGGDIQAFPSSCGGLGIRVALPLPAST